MVFSESEDTGLLKETYSFTYAISNPDILKSAVLGWVVSEEIFNQVRIAKAALVLSCLSLSIYSVSLSTLSPFLPSTPLLSGNIRWM